MRRLEQAGSRRGKTEKSLGTDEKAFETFQKVLWTNRKVFGDKADYRQRIEVVLRAPEQLKRGKDHVRRHERQTEEDAGEGGDTPSRVVTNELWPMRIGPSSISSTEMDF